jgi:hypothetical protein
LHFLWVKLSVALLSSSYEDRYQGSPLLKLGGQGQGQGQSCGALLLHAWQAGRLVRRLHAWQSGVGSGNGGNGGSVGLGPS